MSDVWTETDDRLESKTATDLLAWALDRFGTRLALASSFGAEDVVLIDLLAGLAGLGARTRVFTLDTGRLHEETYALIERVRERYDIAIDVYAPSAQSVERLVRERGVNLFYRSIDDRRRCCHVRKVEPLGRALAGVDAWISGLRREQAPSRTAVRKVEPDPAHPGRVKLNPLADWTSADVWRHIRAHDVPYNALHDRGYPSIGCAPCTRAVEPGEDARAGRWWWEQDRSATECGLHPGRPGVAGRAPGGDATSAVAVPAGRSQA